jgi:hypothetical protein
MLNALSDFTVTIVPTKTARRVTGVLIGWGAKGALLMAWMPPSIGIVMCNCDVSESVTQSKRCADPTLLR